MLGDWDKFSCTACAAAPILQKKLGCFEEVEYEVARYAEIPFNNCPFTYRTKRTVIIARLGTSGYLDDLGPIAAGKLPAKRIAALEYVEKYLLEWRKLDNRN